MFKKLGYAALITVAAAAFVIGLAATGEAKTKKKMAAPPPPAFCLINYQPVCGAKGKTRATWANACFAAQNGAKVVYQGACKVHKAKAKKKSAKKPAMKKPAAKKAMKK